MVGRRLTATMAALAWLPLAATAQLPFFDDFTATGRPSAALWEPTHATVCDGARLRPPTVGVLTLDALQSDLTLHPQAATTTFGADTLTSRRIDLSAYGAADSLVLSFFYLPGGGSGPLWERTGDAPEAADSLCLDLLSPADSVWHTVWHREGATVDQLGGLWQYAAFAIDDTAYLRPGFRFRLRNLCSLDAQPEPGMVGNSDQWHIDYLLLDAHRTTVAPPAFADLAFAGPAPSPVLPYRAVPARQFAPDMLADTLRLLIANLDTLPLASQYAYFMVDRHGDTLTRYEGGFENAPAWLPLQTYQTHPPHAAPPMEAQLPATGEEASFTFVHTLRMGLGGDSRPRNDTVSYTLHLGDHYAYDDGTAEGGFGMTTTAQGTAALAVRFDLRTHDTLRAVDLHFNATLADANRAIGFRLCVWQASADGNPGTLLYRDATPRTIAAVGRYERHELETPVAVEGAIFVGFEQTSNGHINLGFDRSHNTIGLVRTRTSSSWQGSVLEGSLMLRPVLATPPQASIHSPAPPLPLAIHPNPATTRTTLHLPDSCPLPATLTLFDGRGRPLRQATLHARLAPIDLRHLPTGVYLARVTAANGWTAVARIIIKNP